MTKPDPVDPALRKQWEDRLARPASIMTMRRSGAPKEPTSWFGRVTMGHKRSAWPSDQGSAFWPLCQIVVSELPFVPESLRDIAMIQVFLDPEYPELWQEGEVIRVFKSLDRVVPIKEPEHNSPIKAAPVGWKLLERDLPKYDDFPEDMPEELREAWMDEFEVYPRTKVGGWPYLIQHWVVWPERDGLTDFEYVFQIGWEKKLNWSMGDGGVAYFGRGKGEHRDKWCMHWQTS